MVEQSELKSTASALHVSMGLFTRRIRESWPDELSLPERTLLSRLDRGGPATAAVLARREEISAQAVGVTVAALEARGFVSKSPDPTDGRRTILSITSEGLEMLHAGRAMLTERFAVALAEGFSPAEVRQLEQAVPLIERLADLI